MAAKKEPVEIDCSECFSHFRLWVPADMMSELERGAGINCVRCGAAYTVKRSAAGFSVISAAKNAVRQSQFQPSMPEPSMPESAAEAKESILLIEDDRLAREMVDHTFRDSGMTVLLAKNAKEALRILQKQPVSLIVTDMHLKNPSDPESTMDGDDLLKKVAALGLKIPSIITTGKDIVDDLVEDPKWFDLNVKGFIQKGNPFWVEELKAKIQELL